MNSYTEGQRAEMLDVWLRVMDRSGGTFQEFWAELTKPPKPQLRGNCPVMYDEDDNVPNLICFARSIDNEVCHNIRPLIPVDKLDEIFIEVVREVPRITLGQSQKAREAFTAKITAYTTEASNE